MSTPNLTPYSSNADPASRTASVEADGTLPANGSRDADAPQPEVSAAQNGETPNPSLDPLPEITLPPVTFQPVVTEPFPDKNAHRPAPATTDAPAFSVTPAPGAIGVGISSLPSNPPPPASLPVREPIAPEGMRPPVANPLLHMLMGAILACMLIGFGMFLQARRSGTGPVDPVTMIGGGAGISNESNNAIVQAVRRVAPAVLNVDTRFGKEAASAVFLPPPGMDSQPREGKGTGVIIDSKKGWMLTNAHVVAGAQNIRVTTREGDQYAGKLLGSDRQSDIAVVELEKKNLPAAKLADFKNTKDLAIGQWAIAIGNPFAQANTVTVGVVSAVGRAIPVPGGKDGSPFFLTDMIQTDAAINPGNSGGPLCNIRGEVIGINTAIFGIGTGLGFSIPISKAKSVADQIITKGRVTHPFIGVRMQVITDALQAELGLPDRYGALIQAVEPKSPAANAKLQEGDVIREIDGQKMKNSEDVQRYISGKSVGDVLKIEILRNSSVKKTLNLKVGDRPNPN